LDNFVEFLVDFWTKLSNFDNCRNSYEIATEGEGEREGSSMQVKTKTSFSPIRTLTHTRGAECARLGERRRGKNFDS
jgi:hypothetical protein